MEERQDAVRVCLPLLCCEAKAGLTVREVRRPRRSPIGQLTGRMTRFLSVLYFSQCLFLVFSAVYIAKESLEQVVLGGGGHDHGGHSHGHAEHDENRRVVLYSLH